MNNRSTTTTTSTIIIITVTNFTTITTTIIQSCTNEVDYFKTGGGWNYETNHVDNKHTAFKLLFMFNSMVSDYHVCLETQIFRIQSAELDGFFRTSNPKLNSPRGDFKL